MTEFKHTPGPWVFDDINGWIYQQRDPLTKYVIAIMQGSNDDDGVLMAAAPKLLNALVGLVDSLAENCEDGMTKFTDEMIEARAAIAKANGQ